MLWGWSTHYESHLPTRLRGFYNKSTFANTVNTSRSVGQQERDTFLMGNGVGENQFNHWTSYSTSSIYVITQILVDFDWKCSVPLSYSGCVTIWRIEAGKDFTRRPRFSIKDRCKSFPPFYSWFRYTPLLSRIHFGDHNLWRSIGRHCRCLGRCRWGFSWWPSIRFSLLLLHLGLRLLLLRILIHLHRLRLWLLMLLLLLLERWSIHPVRHSTLTHNMRHDFC